MDNDLELLTTRRADAEQIDDDVNFLTNLGLTEGGTDTAKPATPAAKPKPKPTTKASELLPAQEAEPSPPKPKKPAPEPDGDLQKLAAGGGSEERGVIETGVAAAKDIGMGAIEAPEQIVGGMAEAVNAMVGLGDMLQDLVPTDGMQLFDLDGNWNPKLVNAAEIAADMNARTAAKQGMLPTPGEAKTVTGGMVNGVSQFLTGFATGGHVFKGIGVAGKVGFATRATAQGMFSDFAAFDGHEERLSNLVNSFPMLANPVTEYLAADPEDSELEGRFKNVAEGVIPDALFTGFVSALRSVKQARTVKAATGAKTYTQAADALANEVKATGVLPTTKGDPLAALGDSTPGAPLFIKGKIQSAEKATADIKPSTVAPKPGTSPLAPKVPVGETFINFARINSDDDIKSVLRSMAKEGAADIKTAQRGVRSNVETLAAAGKKYDDVWNGLVQRRQGELNFNAEEQLALRQLWNSSGERLMQTAKLAEAQPTAENLLAFRKMLTIHKTVQDQAMAVRTETARALQQWNIPAGTGGKERINAMHNILLQHGGADVNIDLVRKFSGLADEIAANPKAMEKLSKATEKADSYKTLKAVNEAWIGISLLSGPKTHVRNMISNMGMMAASVGERAVASRVNGLLSERPAVEIGEAAAQVAGIFANVRQAWSDAVHTFKTGTMKEGMSQLDIPPEMAMRSLDQNTLLGKTMYALSYAANPVFRGLMASDQLFKTMNYGGEIKALAYREAMRAFRDGEISRTGVNDMVADIIRNPPKEMHEAALETSAMKTFTNDPGKLTKSILRLRSEYPGLRFVIPFVNTPANVFRTSIEYSPLAPVLSKYRNAIAKGGPQASLARTKLAMGSAAMLEMVNLSMDGKITGSGPEPGSAEYEALKRTGWRPYTVRIGDKWVSYRGVEPFSTVMGMGADIGDYVRYGDDDTSSAEAIKDMMAVGVFSVADNMLDRAFLKGLADAFAAINDPDMNASRFADNFFSSFVPRGLQEVRNVTDPAMRDARTMMDSFKTRIPYMSMTVPERRDEWGRVTSMESGWGKAYDAMSPFYASSIAIEPIDRELMQQGFGVGHATRSMQLDTARVSFKNRADIHNRYLELRGQTTASELDPKLARRYRDETLLDVLNGIVTGNHPLAKKYAQGSDGEGGEKHRLLQKVVRDFGKAAKKRLVDEFPEIKQDVARELEDRSERAKQGDNLYEELEGVD